MRYWYGAGLADWTFLTGASGTAILTSTAVTFWTAPSGGTRYTDLLDVQGTPITEVLSGDDITRSLGTLPRFQGPPDVTGMWADAGTGVRAWMTADQSEIVAALTGRVEALETQLADVQTRLANALYGIRYDAEHGEYPAIPAAVAAFPYLVFIGPEIPAMARRKDLHIHTPE